MSDTGGLGGGLIGAFISRAIGEGMGVTAARNLFRESGIGRMSNAAFSQLYGEVRRGVGQGNDLAGVDYNAIPSGEVYAPLRARQNPAYISSVEVASREVGTRGVMTRFISIRTSEPHTPQQAVDAAVEIASTLGGPSPGLANHVVLGGWVTRMFRTAPWEG